MKDEMDLIIASLAPGAKQSIRNEIAKLGEYFEVEKAIGKLHQRILVEFGDLPNMNMKIYR